MKLDKTKKYDLSKLTDEQLDKLCNEIGIINSFIERGFLLYSEHFRNWIITMLSIGSDLKLTCATELFEDNITKQNMRELDKSKVYNLSDLTIDERNVFYKKNANQRILDDKWKYFSFQNERWVFSKKNYLKKETTNAKELFYTLENVQVDCMELTEEQIKDITDVFEANGLKHAFLCNNVSKTTITYDKFMELFAPQYEVKMIVEAPTMPTLEEFKLKCETANKLLKFDEDKPQHYANGIDTFERMEANCTIDECLAFAKGNIDKYNFRKKGQDLEDYKKIISYANWAIKLLENDKTNN